MLVSICRKGRNRQDTRNTRPHRNMSAVSWGFSHKTIFSTRLTFSFSLFSWFVEIVIFPTVECFRKKLTIFYFFTFTFKSQLVVKNLYHRWHGYRYIKSANTLLWLTNFYWTTCRREHGPGSGSTTTNNPNHHDFAAVVQWTGKQFFLNLNPFH